MNYRNALLITTLLLGIGAFVKGGYTHLKAQFAQHLLEHAWTHGVLSKQAKKPWPWADTQAVARLAVSGQNLSMIVLDGISGESMAFGPGMIKTRGTSNHTMIVIGGHRDTHMSFLQDLTLGDNLQIENIDGSIENYIVKETLISNVDNEQLQINNSENSMVLVTCFPFDSIVTGGPLRYVVIARQQKIIAQYLTT